MFKIRIAVAAFTASSLAAVAPSMAMSKHQTTCKPPITAAGQHKVKQIALKIARQSWGQQASAAYGQVWASPSKASVFQDSCQHGQQGWTCIFVARPCKYLDTRVSPNAPGTGPGRSHRQRHRRVTLH